MQPVLTNDDDTSQNLKQQVQQSNGNYTLKSETNGIQTLKPEEKLHSQNINGTSVNGQLKEKEKATVEEGKNNDEKETEKIALPVEMACMVPLRVMLGKLVHKAHSDLMTLVDTLPSMSEVEKKRQILNYTTFIRKQFAKVLALVKWAENANDIQMCQNIMAFLANQNKIFQDTVDYLHKIQSDLPAARLRNFDIPTAVDVLTTGTYQRMPTKIQDMLAPPPLTDEEVLETFQNMNDVIRMRMITTEVLPSPLLNTYRIENGRITFKIENEFEVALTLMGPPQNRRWWIVSLDMFVQATSMGGGAAEDVDFSLSDVQKQHLRMNAQKQLVPPIPATSSQQPQQTQTDTVSNIVQSSTDGEEKSQQQQQDQLDEQQPRLFFPLVHLYDYLHLCCLNLQLEILYIQSALLAKTRWVNQLQVQMSPDRTKLSLIYWRGGSPASQWARPQPFFTNKSTVIEILLQEQQEFTNSITNAASSVKTAIPNLNNQQQRQASAGASAATIMKAVRDEYKGMIQKAGIGASIALDKIIDQNERVKVLNMLKYPKDTLQALWNDCPDLFTDEQLLDPANLNMEQVVLHVTNYHGKCMIEKFRQTLITQKDFLAENGLWLMGDNDFTNDSNETTAIVNQSPTSSSVQANMSSALVIRYQHQKYISIEIDTRSGKVKAFDTNNGCGETKLRGLEERLNHDPVNIARHLVWLRSEVVIHEVISLAKQLNLQPFHPSQMNLRMEDFSRLFEETLLDIQSTSPTTDSSSQKYPSHCIFLQFSQFEDWYLVLTILKNKFKTWLCCIRKARDQQHGVYQTIADFTNFDTNQLWKSQFVENAEGSKGPEFHEISHGNHSASTANSNKRGLQEENECNDNKVLNNCEHQRNNEGLILKKRRTSMLKGYRMSEFSQQNNISLYLPKIDCLSINLRFLAKLDSLSRAWIINRKIELQILSFKGLLTYHTRSLLYSLSVLSNSSSGHSANGNNNNFVHRNNFQNLGLNIQAALSHPAADKVEAIFIPQSDLLKACTYHLSNDAAFSYQQRLSIMASQQQLQVPNTSPASSMLLKREKPVMEAISWTDRLLPRLKHSDVLIRSSGWWDCGRRSGDCYVIVQQKLNESRSDVRQLLQSDLISLQGVIDNDLNGDKNKFDKKQQQQREDENLGDHISFDKSALILSFTYSKIDTCIEQFLLDWERTFMMMNLTRQIASVWFQNYSQDQLQFNPTNLQELSFTYASNLTCTIKWCSLGKGYTRQYNIEFGIKNEEEEKEEKVAEEQNDISESREARTQEAKRKRRHVTMKAFPALSSRNPHWRIANFLRDALNEKRDLIHFVQILFQTLPLMTCLERLEVKCAQSGDIGKVSIIPRAYDSVRVIFSAVHAIDIQFTDTSMICVSDAAYHRDFYSCSSPKQEQHPQMMMDDVNMNTGSFIPPPPYLVPHQPSTLPSPQLQQNENTIDASSVTSNSQHQPSSSILKPINVAQQFKFTPFDHFSEALKSIETWIFDEEQDGCCHDLRTPSTRLDALYPSIQFTDNPCAYPMQHGLLCSASLCQCILNKLQAMV
ncbi:mediator complex subunit MED14-domain-containing protein [Mycotypha africana]|uniref:mediator complex subunit MED14-domain-containing protein n=1 Tax=Mycotypha africana TaxID=64632 RepID=UPI0023012386|nr:mediator complex subunit MED14-domain-containing protein [Mycotypha africana]KAI8967316.1 mediator complex subunit MED14-domain-containing protein [Mycotypha africana]